MLPAGRETQQNHCLSIGCFQHFVLDLSRTEISLLSVSFYLSSKLSISLLTSVFHWSHWGLMACFNVRSTSCRITHMLKCCYWSWGSTTLPFSLEHCGSVTSMDATICSQDASHMWTPSAQVIAFWHFVNLYSSQVVSKHSKGIPPRGQGNFTWNHCFSKGCFEKHIFWVVLLVSCFTAVRMYLA